MKQMETGSFAPRHFTQRLNGLQVVSWNIARGSEFHAIVDFLLAADAAILFIQEIRMPTERITATSPGKCPRP